MKIRITQDCKAEWNDFTKGERGVYNLTKGQEYEFAFKPFRDFTLFYDRAVEIVLNNDCWEKCE